MTVWWYSWLTHLFFCLLRPRGQPSARSTVGSATSWPRSPSPPASLPWRPLRLTGNLSVALCVPFWCSSLLTDVHLSMFSEISPITILLSQTSSRHHSLTHIVPFNYLVKNWATNGRRGFVPGNTRQPKEETFDGFPLHLRCSDGHHLLTKRMWVTSPAVGNNLAACSWKCRGWRLCD